MTKIFCDFCEAEIINEPEGFVMKMVDKVTGITLNEAVTNVPAPKYQETTQVACKECKDKTKKFLKKINEV